MSATLDEYHRLKEGAETKRRRADRAQGELTAARKRLREDFGCESIADAKKKLEELRAREARLLEKFKTRLAAFKEKWSHVLG